MFENNQVNYDKLRAAIHKNWQEISDEEFSSTRGDVEEVVKLISQRYQMPGHDVREQIQRTILVDDLNLPYDENMTNQDLSFEKRNAGSNNIF